MAPIYSAKAMPDVRPCPFHNAPPRFDFGFKDCPHDVPYIFCPVVYRDETGADHICGCSAFGFAAWNTRALMPETEPPGTRALALANAAQVVIDHYRKIHKGQGFRTVGMDLLKLLEAQLTDFREVV